MKDEDVGLKLNGIALQCKPEQGETLLQLLRRQSKFSGAKLGCGGGSCGACTVLVDGRPEQACQVSLSSIEGAEITTPVAVVASGLGRAVADALIAEGAAQCGYCLPGIVVSATAALSQGGAETDLSEALARNICRCGTHSRILAALEKVRAAQ